MIALRSIATFNARGSVPTQEDYLLNVQDKGIFIAADGFGGDAGARASQAACEAVRGFLVKEARDQDATLPFEIRSYFSLAGNVLFNSLIHANRKVNELNRGKSGNEKGGTSVIAGYLDGTLLALASVGACSAWLLREGRMVELVTPRTHGRMADPFSEDAAPDQRTPLISLGTCEQIEPEVYEVHLRAGDWLIFQTDGIRSELRQDLLGLQGKRLSETQAVQQALELAQQGLYDDNASFSLMIF